MTAPLDRPLRIVLVDDQPLVRAGFSMVIDSQDDMSVVAQAADGAAAVEELRARTVDVVLMDVRMPRMDGIEATSRILAQAPEGRAPKIIVLTTFDLDEYVVSAIRAGASGFLLKDAQPEELLAAIRTVHSGDAVIAPSATRRLLARVVATPEPQEKDTSMLEALTEREREVLTLMGRGYSNRGDRRRAVRRRGDGEDPCGPGALQARGPGPRPGRDHRLRDRPGLPRR